MTHMDGRAVRQEELGGEGVLRMRGGGGIRNGGEKHPDREHHRVEGSTQASGGRGGHRPRVCASGGPHWEGSRPSALSTHRMGQRHTGGKARAPWGIHPAPHLPPARQACLFPGPPSLLTRSKLIY